MVNECIQRTCCFFGNRIINDTKELRAALTKTLEGLITQVQAKPPTLNATTK